MSLNPSPYSSVRAHELVGDAIWRRVSWRRGTKGWLAARLAALPARVAGGPTQRIRDMGNQYMQGEGWAAERTDGLVGKRRSNGEPKCYLLTLPSGPVLKALPAEGYDADPLCTQVACEGHYTGQSRQPQLQAAYPP